MTREQKLALILGFALTLGVTVLISDHFSTAREEPVGQIAVDSRLLEERPHERVQFQVPENPARTVQPRQDEPTTLVMGGEGSNIPQGIRNQFLTQPKSNEHGAEDREAINKIRDGFNRRTNANDNTRSKPISTRPQSQPAKPATKITRHQVAAKETLWSIAQDYYRDGNLANKLADYNISRGYLKNRNVIRVNATILVPPRSEITAVPAKVEQHRTSKPAPPPAKQTTQRTHTIARNDTAWGLAKKYLGNGGRWKEIVELNREKIPNPDKLPIGVTIRIPAS